MPEDIDFIHDLGSNEKDFSADGKENVFWPKKTLLGLVNSKIDVALKLVVQGKIVGFCLVMIHPVTKKAVLENFYVLEGFERFINDFYKEVEKHIKLKGAQFIAYFFDVEDDVNNIDFFKKSGYFVGNNHLWLHKNINFSNPFKKE